MRVRLCAVGDARGKAAYIKQLVSFDAGLWKVSREKWQSAWQQLLCQLATLDLKWTSTDVDRIGKVVLDGGASDVSPPTSATPTTTPTAGPKLQSLHDILTFVDDAPALHDILTSSRPAATSRKLLKLVLPAEAFCIVNLQSLCMAIEAALWEKAYSSDAMNVYKEFALNSKEKNPVLLKVAPYSADAKLWFAGPVRTEPSAHSFPLLDIECGEMATTLYVQGDRLTTASAECVVPVWLAKTVGKDRTAPNAQRPAYTKHTAFRPG